MKPHILTSDLMHVNFWSMEKVGKDTGQVHRTKKRAIEKEEGWCHVWVFDHSSCHSEMADNALDVNKTNVRLGGKQRLMRDTT